MSIASAVDHLREHPYDDRAFHAFLHELAKVRPGRGKGERPPMAELLVGPLVVSALAEDGFFRSRRLVSELGDRLLAEGAEAGWLWSDISRAVAAVVRESRFRSQLHYDRVAGLVEELWVDLAAGPPGLPAVLALPKLGDEVSFRQLCARAFYWDPRCQVELMHRMLARSPEVAARRARLVELAEWGWASIAELWADSGRVEPVRAQVEELRAGFREAVGDRFPKGYPHPDPTRTLARQGKDAPWWFPRPMVETRTGVKDKLARFEPRHECPACGVENTYPAPRPPDPAAGAPRLAFHQLRELESLGLEPVLAALRPRAPDPSRCRDCPACKGKGKALDPGEYGPAADFSGPCLACADWVVALEDPWEIGELLAHLDRLVPQEKRRSPALAALYLALNDRRDRWLSPAILCSDCHAVMPPLLGQPLDEDVIVHQGLLPAGKAGSRTPE